MTPIDAVTKAQRQLRSVIHLLTEAYEHAPNLALAVALTSARKDIAATERSLDAVAFALRDVADPTRGVR